MHSQGRDEILGTAYSDHDLGAGLQDPDSLLDDDRWIEWRGGRAHQWSAASVLWHRLTAHRGINLNVHKAADLRQWAAAREWLTMYCLPLEADAALTEAGDYRDQILD